VHIYRDLYKKTQHIVSFQHGEELTPTHRLNHAILLRGDDSCMSCKTSAFKQSPIIGLGVFLIRRRRISYYGGSESPPNLPPELFCPNKNSSPNAPPLLLIEKPWLLNRSCCALLRRIIRADGWYAAGTQNMQQRGNWSERSSWAVLQLIIQPHTSYLSSSIPLPLLVFHRHRNWRVYLSGEINFELKALMF